MADTYGTFTFGAARVTIVNDFDVPVSPNFCFPNAALPHLAQAFRRSKYRAPHSSHALALRYGAPSSITR